ncbi:MAG: DUF3943 domain-containing protein [Treponema sp.]|nr:DUF3943 domain-containing protein [Treponema sp.]
MKIKILPAVILCLILLFSNIQPLFSDDNETGVTIKDGLIAGAEVLLSNAVVMTFNIVANKLQGGFDWAQPNLDSIKFNLTTPWQWETDDGYLVNQIGHPYQGSVYFNAGRVNGFSFYQSFFFSAFGSATWEVFFENPHASINDFITTVPSSMSVGEILFRLYIEAYNSGVPAFFAFFINPMAGFHRLVTGWQPQSYESNIYELKTYIGMGYTQIDSSAINPNNELFSFDGFYADLGFMVIYGNPFEQESKTPYDHFEFTVSVGLDIGNYMDFRLISDGYLFSFSPVYSDKNKMSTGLSLHLDVAALGRLDNFKMERQSSTINQYSNAINWTLKYQHQFSDNMKFQIKYHCGFTFFGVSIFYSPYINDELINYGAGINSKLFLNFEHNKLGKLETSLFGYSLWSYPGTSAISGGSVYWLFLDVSYSYFITKHLSLCVNGSLAQEWGMFKNFPDIERKNRAVKLYAVWNL